jgi:hypothetical protein
MRKENKRQSIRTATPFLKSSLSGAELGPRISSIERSKTLGEGGVLDILEPMPDQIKKGCRLKGFGKVRRAN